MATDDDWRAGGGEGGRTGVEKKSFVRDFWRVSKGGDLCKPSVLDISDTGECARVLNGDTKKAFVLELGFVTKGVEVERSEKVETDDVDDAEDAEDAVRNELVSDQGRFQSQDAMVIVATSICAKSTYYNDSESTGTAVILVIDGKTNAHNT